jgi:hypothetical protein
LVLYFKQAMFFGARGAGTTMSVQLQKRHDTLTSAFKCLMACFVPGAIGFLVLDDIVSLVVSQTDTHQGIRVAFDFFLWEQILLAIADISISIILALMFAIPLLVLSARRATEGPNAGNLGQQHRVKTRRLRAIAKTNLRWSRIAVVSTSMFITLSSTLLPNYTTIWIATGGLDVSCVNSLCEAGCL